MCDEGWRERYPELLHDVWVADGSAHDTGRAGDIALFWGRPVGGFEVVRVFNDREEWRRAYEEFSGRRLGR